MSLYQGVELEKTAANFSALTPISALKRTERVYPESPAQIHGRIRRNWAEVADRCKRLASALSQRGIGKGDTVSLIAPNIPEALECALAVPMLGAVLNANNVRLDAATLGYILSHGEAKVLLADTEFSELAREAVSQSGLDLLVVDIEDPEGPGGECIGALTYDALLAEGTPEFPYTPPGDEWDALALNYTSGTTGRPKGVVYSHRGAWTNAINNVVTWEMPHHPVYLWTLPLFHCNGWCFPWTVTLLAGTHVFLRSPTAAGIYQALADHGVTHLCGAPIIMSMIVNADGAERTDFSQTVRMMTAAAPPPPQTILAMEQMGISITHVYGLTEVYGPAVVCANKATWSSLSAEEQARLKARQGVAYELQEDVLVLDPATSAPVPWDGKTQGEVAFRGNIVMKGYFKQPEATAQAFANGWFWSGDLAVQHPDGYIEIRDRSKDIIISGGENISSIEIENAIYSHPDVLCAAVVAMPDEKWGESVTALICPTSTNLEDLKRYTKSKIPDHMYPKVWKSMDALPITEMGKRKRIE